MPNDDYMSAKTAGNTITELMWDRLQEGINANRRFRLQGFVGCDNMRYDTTKVIWDTNGFIYFTRESDGAWVYNQINANPTTGITCADNDLLYVTLNDTNGTVLTVSAADYTAMLTDNTGRVLIIGTVWNSRYYARFGGDHLGNHIATQNIELGSNYLSGDGGDEGLQVDANGKVTTSQDLGVGGELQVSGTTKTAAHFYAGATAPTDTTRLNYDGYLYPTRCYNAVYNDYADFWGELPEGEEPQPGKVYVTLPNKKVTIAFKQADQRCIGVCSDTFGFAVGEKVGAVPLAVAGFVLAYVDKEYPPGTLLVNTKDGTLTRARFWERFRVIAKFIAPEPRNAIILDPEDHSKKIDVLGRCWIKIV